MKSVTSETLESLQAKYDALFAELTAIKARANGTAPTDPCVHQISVEMARITLEMHHLKRSSSGKTPLGIAQPLTSPPKRRDPDVLIMGVRKLKLLNAIERALEEADHPLDADDIAYIIGDNRWARPFRRNPRETIQDALTRHFSSGNQLDIEVIEDGKTCHYWLRRKGTPRSKQSRAFPHES